MLKRARKYNNQYASMGHKQALDQSSKKFQKRIYPLRDENLRVKEKSKTRASTTI